MPHITSDNSQLSEPFPQQTSSAVDCTDHDGRRSGRASAVDCTFKFATAETPLSAVDCTFSPTAFDYTQAALSENTRRAYASDLNHFAAWGGTIPASPDLVASYLTAYAGHLRVPTLLRHLVAISKAHASKNLNSPTRSHLVRTTLQGIRRVHRTTPRRARPLLKDDLFAILDLTHESPRDIRDRALLLIGFAGGFRRSELVSIVRSDIEMRTEGLVVNIRRSKTDQVGAGRSVGIPIGRTRWCPVQALAHWLTISRIVAGPLFPPIDRRGRIANAGLSTDAVSRVVKRRVSAIALDPTDFSAHSLRAGFVTSAAIAGLPFWKIQQQTGHSSQAGIRPYIRDADLFRDNAAGSLL